VTTIRIVCMIVGLFAVMYAAAGLLESLTHFGIGAAVAAAAILVYGATDYIESHRREQLSRHRAEVWHRRDLEAQQALRANNLYEQPRDGLAR
jgi:flavin-dependent dehydrogenase